jgi:hypothetical protein
MLAMNDDFIRMETRVRILNEQIHELKTNGPTPPLAARVYRSLLEADPPMLQEAEETRAFLYAETDAGNPVTAGSRPPL